MTRDNLLEVGDLILYMAQYSADLLVVDKVTNTKARIIKAGGFHSYLDRQTDGNRAKVMGVEENAFAIRLVIPKRKLI
ncbi:hypothetical protein HNQ91_000695 [Filimonas zeae]|uniref:Uncharacterized protein n=1 Tax=Filimonas zeae TaxID=1737353 RepID=A0A917MTJ0_9BACT|nr:hypothetical protein [Filimonas zeae]MDR6337673.1 hypothetical protein [Filimonas zeae]GGH59732.1 hypothetical protein GCM10011379_06830 [Filimonas zeae]